MAKKSLLLPAFPNNETINSYLERSGSYNLGCSLNRECRNFFGRARASLDATPCNIRRFCEEVNYIHGDEDLIIREHTLFNFYSCGLFAADVEKFKERLIDGAKGPIRPTRLPVLCTPAEQERLRCPLCDEENHNRFGFSFFSRFNAAPFVHVCAKHEIELAPHTLSTGIYDSACRAGYGNKSAILNYSVRLHSCIQRDWKISIYRREEVLKMLILKHWLSSDLKCHISKFLVTFHKMFGNYFSDERLHYMCNSEKHIQAGLRTLLRKDRHANPIWCVLFEWFAEETENSNAQFVSLPPKLRISKIPSSEVISAALNAEGTLTAAAKFLEVDINKLTAFARRYGITIKSRPKRLGDDDFRRVEELLAKGNSMAVVAHDCMVSLSTVYRIALARPACRKMQLLTQAELRLKAERMNWLTALKESMGSSTTELRRSNSATWTYLYRHDPVWLKQHPASSNNVHKKQLVPERPAILRNVAERALAAAFLLCSSENHVPVRRSRYRLQQVTGLSEYGLSSILANDDSIVEGRVEFLKRRLEWALQGSSDDVVLSPRWRLARKAGLRVRSIDTLDPTWFIVNKRKV